MGKRHQARELALKVLFQLESSDDDPDEVLRYHAAEGAATSDVAHFATQLVRGVIANRHPAGPQRHGRNGRQKQKRRAVACRDHDEARRRALSAPPRPAAVGMAPWLTLK